MEAENPFESPAPADRANSGLPIRAGADRKFIRRYLYIAIACIGVILWCVYDLQVKYPSELMRSTAYYEIIESDRTEQQKNEAWTRITTENGWSMTEPDRIDIIEGHISFQYWIGGVCILAGIAFFFYYFRTLSSWVEADQTGLTTSWGRDIKFEQIERIDKRKWEKKGIAKIVYKKNKDDEMERTFLLDDLKYERKTVDRMLDLIEATLADEQIVGGERESEMRKQKAAENKAAETE